MLLRNSISTTKKFLQKTLQGFKSLFSGGDYHKLPKSPPFNMRTTQTSYKELEKFYTDFTDKWESDKEKVVKGKSKKKTILITSSKQENEAFNNGGSFMKYVKPSSPVKNYQIEAKADHHHHHQGRHQNQRTKRRQEEDSCSSNMGINNNREGRILLVAQKLKEVAMMDMSDVDHVLDIEEVLHYYSRLTCPAYLDIVDKFFTDMYTEFFGSPATPRCITSRQKLRTVVRS